MPKKKAKPKPRTSWSEGQACEVLVGPKWRRAKVIGVGTRQHHSGNSYCVYTVQLRGSGSVIMCGNNSIRAVKEPKR